MNNLFQKDNFKVRTVIKDGDVLFCARDIAVSLGYQNPSREYNNKCKSLISLSYTDLVDLKFIGNSDAQGTVFIKESDVYRLVLKSSLPSADKFQDWIVEEVLPSIRKTGSYSLTKNASWLQARQDGKVVRREETDTIKLFVEYATKQGSTKASMYYMAITKGVHSALYVLEKGANWKAIRETLGTTDLQVLSTCEHVAQKYIKEGMDLEMHYKDIYRYAIAKVEEMARIIGKKETLLTVVKNKELL